MGWEELCKTDIYKEERALMAQRIVRKSPEEGEQRKELTVHCGFTFEEQEQTDGEVRWGHMRTKQVN